MFTGLVEYVGTIESLERSDAGRVPIASGKHPRRTPGPPPGPRKIGQHPRYGCCLTAVEISGESFAADLPAKRLRRTSFGRNEPGHAVNLERPLTAMKELGGHFMARPRGRSRAA